MVELAVNLCGQQLKNPVMPASGVFGFGWELADLFDLNLLGAIACKGTTAQPRFGNPTPRIAETAAGMLNAVGLQNPGAAAVLAEELPRLRQVYHGVVVVNVSGFAVEEYREVCALLGPAADILELNISCPNVRHGGMSFGTDPSLAATVCREVKQVTDTPLIVKLSPNVNDIVAIAQACQAAGADGLCLINTLLGMEIDLRTQKPLLANVMGGLSGPAILPLALRMVYQVYQAVSIPIVGVGGISSAEDAVKMMLAGATAVQVGAASLVRPQACPEIIDGLPPLLQRLGVDKISDIIGGAHR